MSQTLSEDYGNACVEIEILLWKHLAQATNEDRNFVYGASRCICHWVDCVKPAMAFSGKSAEEQTRLLATAQEARKDALDSISNFIPADGDPPKLTSIFLRITTLLGAALGVSRRHTDNALWNIHSQLSDLIRDNVPSDRAGSFFNTLLELTCSFRQDMDRLATSQVLLPSQLIPNIWDGRKEVLEGLSLMGSPSCSASWLASLIEWVTVVPAPKKALGLLKTPTKSDPTNPRAVKGTLDSGKRQLTIKEASKKYWGSKERRQEDEEARKREEERRKKPAVPVLSLAEHEDTVDDLVKQHAPSRVSQPANQASTSGAEDRAKARLKHLLPVASDNEPLSDEAEEPKAKSQKRDPEPDLIVIADDSTPLPSKVKSTGKKSRTVTAPDEEGYDVMAECLKAEAWAQQYNIELAPLNNYRNLQIPNLPGPPNTDDHSEYLKDVKNISWSYPAQGNVITTRQYYDDLKSCGDQEVIDAGNLVLRKKGMMGIPKENSKDGPVKCRNVIYVLRDVASRIIDARDSSYGRDWNIGLYDIVSPASTKKIEKSSNLVYKGKSISGKVTYRYCPFCSYVSTNHRALNNHIRMHLRLTLACGMKDCWFVTHSSDAMWKHAAVAHGLATAEPIVAPVKKK